MVRYFSRTVILLALVSLTNTSPVRQSTAGEISHEVVRHAQKRSFGSPCTPLSYVTLVIKLNSIGGYNKRYVATTKQEAMQNFPNLLNTTTIVPNATSHATMKPTSTAPSNFTQTTQPYTSTAVANMSSHSAANTSSYTTMNPALPSHFTQATPIAATPTVQSAGKHINTQMISMARRGTKDEYGFYRLCTEWTAITTLSSDFFPRYLNEVICDSKDFHCLSYGGLCVQKTFIVSILRRSGRCTAQGREEWLEYSQPIRSCCECKMFPGSAHTGLL